MWRMQKTQKIRLLPKVFELSIFHTKTIISGGMFMEPVRSFFPFMGIGSLLYALFYTICLYHNPSGLSYPFYIGGTCFFFCCFLRKCTRTLKPMAVFDLISLMLLSVSICCTDSAYLILLGKWMIFILFLHLFLHSFYDDSKWDIFSYLNAMLKTLFSSIRFFFRPFTDLYDYSKGRSKAPAAGHSRILAVILGLVIALLALPVILLLLGSADAVFAHLFHDLFQSFEDLILDGNLLTVLVMMLFAFFASYCFMCRLQSPNLKEDITDGNHDPLIAITFTSVFSFVYVLFCVIQIVYLFAGLGTLPGEYTYASYAREGFFQLVFVCLINLVTVLLCIRVFRSHRILQVLLSIISLCTFVMIASSAYRMLLYIQVYHLTVLRVFVLWSLLVISFLMVGTLILIYKPDFPFVRYTLITTTVLFLLYSFSHPDYQIARYNISRMQEETDTSDMSYLYRLSADAAPVVLPILLSEKKETSPKEDDWWYDEQQYYIDTLSEKASGLSLWNWNYSRQRAGKLLNH